MSILRSKFLIDLYKIGSTVIVDRHYVHDYIDRFDTVEECVVTTKNVTIIDREGGVNNRNFVSNNTQVLQSLNVEGNEPSEEAIKLTITIHILGKWWDTRKDKLRYRKY